MKKSLIFLAILATFSASLAAGPDGAKKQLNANYSAISAALKSNNVDRIAAYMADDYTVVQPNGQKFTKQQVLAQFKGFAASLHDVKWVRTIKTLTVSGKSAVAIVAGSFSGSVADPQSGKMHTITQSAVTKDTWMKAAKGFLLEKSEVQKNSMMMDGKPMPTGGR